MRTLKDGIFGLVVGDALGVPYEFLKRGEFKAEGMSSGGVYDLPKGTWSDDSSLNLATMKSIKDKNGIDLVDIAKNFEKWLYEGEFTPFGRTIGIGRTTREGIKNFTKTNNPKTSGLTGIRDNGNGSLMRILPLIFLDVDEKDIKNVSSITHRHPISIEGCRIYVEIGKKLLKGYKLEEAINSTEIRLKEYSRLKELKNLKLDEIKSSGYVVDTLEAALFTLLNTNNLEDALLFAVNLGDDTDTVAAVTGGLGGIIYGYEAIPKKWLGDIQNKDLIYSCIF